MKTKHCISKLSASRRFSVLSGWSDHGPPNCHGNFIILHHFPKNIAIEIHNSLVVWNMAFIFHFIYGMSSFPLPNSYFSRWLLHHQPDTFSFEMQLREAIKVCGDLLVGFDILVELYKIGWCNQFPLFSLLVACFLLLDILVQFCCQVSCFLSGNPSCLLVRCKVSNSIWILCTRTPNLY